MAKLVEHMPEHHATSIAEHAMPGYATYVTERNALTKKLLTLGRYLTLGNARRGAAKR